VKFIEGLLPQGLINLRILHCVHSCDPRGGGVWEAVSQFTMAQLSAGHFVKIVSLDNPDSQWVLVSNLPLYALGPSSSFGFCRKIIPWLREHAYGFDCAIIHGLWQYHGYAVMKIFIEMQIPYFVFPHGMLDPWFKENSPLKHFKKMIYWMIIERKVLSRARGVIFTCQEERNLAANTFQPYSCKALVAPLGIKGTDRSHDVQVDAFFDSFPGLKGRSFLLYLGRIHPKKGLDVLLEAFFQLTEAPMDLVIAGPEDSSVFKNKLDHLVQLVKGKHPEWGCFWTGMLEGDLKWGALRAANAFVLPSHQENFGIAVVEALSVGTPVLVTNKVNIYREIVSAGGGLASEDSLEGIQKMLEKWFSLDVNERSFLSESAKSCFCESFEITQASRNLTRLLQDSTPVSRSNVQ
jgi:glycosyltransferase involved in cell wall biosynthesis